MFAIGGHGLAVQVMLMRSLMAGYAGSELTAAVVLGTWLGVEALGAWLAGRPGPDRLEAAGLAAAVLSALVLPAAILTRPLFGLLAGEQAGLLAAAGASALVAAVPAFLHGMLFVAGCGRYVACAGPPGIGRGYAWEGLGTAAAGLAVAALLLVGVSGLAVVAGFGVLLLLACREQGPGTGRGLGRVPGAVFAPALAGLVLLAAWARPVERLAWQLAWPGFRVTGIGDSWFGKTVRLTREGERTVVYDGVAGSLPRNAPEDEQAAVLPLLHAARGQDVLLLGDGLSAIEPLLELPVETVTLVTRDRALFTARSDAFGLAAAEADPRLRVVFDDPRRFLRRTEAEFDCIINAGSLPLCLSANRLATVEYFELCRRRLGPGGVVAVPLPGGGSGIGRATARLFAVNRATLAAVFDSVLLLALDSPLLVAGDRLREPGRADPAVLARRLAEWRRHRPAETAGLDSTGVLRLLDRFRQERLELELAAATGPGDRAQPNLDWRPRALFLALARREQESGTAPAALSGLLLRAGSPPAGAGPTVSAAVLFLLLVPALLFRRGRATGPTLAIASSGFAGATLVTLGMFVFQTATGALYFGLVLLLACFTFGTVAGSRLGGRAAAARPKPGRAGFLAAEALLVAAPLIMALAGSRVPGWLQFPLLAAAGLALGFQFPVAAAASGSPETGVAGARRRIGHLTAADLGGGIVGLLLVLLLVLPLAGLGWAFATVAALKLASLAVQLTLKPRPGGQTGYPGRSYRALPGN